MTLDEAAIAAGNRTIFSAHGIVAKHRGQKRECAYVDKLGT
jgi:hypothetical protein